MWNHVDINHNCLEIHLLYLIMAFWEMMPSSLKWRHRGFGGICHHYLQGWRWCMQVPTTCQYLPPHNRAPCPWRQYSSQSSKTQLIISVCSVYPRPLYINILWCFSDRASQYRLFQITNLMHNSFIFQQYVCYTTILNMEDQLYHHSLWYRHPL